MTGWPKETSCERLVPGYVVPFPARSCTTFPPLTRGINASFVVVVVVVVVLNTFGLFGFFFVF